MKQGLTEVERRLKEQVPFITASMKMMEEQGLDPKEASLGPFVKLARDMHEVLEQTLGRSVVDQSGSDRQAAANELWHLVKFLANGSRSYKIAPGLAELLIKTSVGRLPMEMLKLPFPSFYLDLPESLDLYMYSLDGCKYPIAGVLVTQAPAGEDTQGVAQLSIAMLAGDSPEKEGVASATFALHLPQDADSLRESAGRVIERMSELLSTGAIRLTLATDQFKTPAQFRKQYKKDITRMINLVANAVLYITCENAEISQLASPRAQLEKKINRAGPSKRSKLKRKLERTSALEQYLLGGSIVIERGAKEEAEYQTGTGRKVIVRHMVAGHWRNQAYGPGQSLRKLTWIAPHYRGPEGAEEIIRKHILR